MNRISFVFLGATLAASPLALAGPTVLDDRQLERVTAGTADYGASSGQFGGGAIVGNASSATLKTTGSVQLEGDVQQGARGINLVNAAESAVANATNIWDGRITSSGAATTLDVNQANSVDQRQANSASLPTYFRSEANIDRMYRETSSTEHKGSVDTVQQIIGQQIQGGEGFSLAGQLDASLDGGRITFTNEFSTKVEGSVGGSGPLGFTTTGATRTEFEARQTLDWQLPQLTVSVKGAGCYVAMGSCDSEGSYESTIEETLIVRSPFTLEDAQAQYIVVDGSTLEATSDYSVVLSGSVQADVRAVNLVNSAGSLVANAANIARTPSVGPSLNLNQVNVIVQGR